MSIGIYLRLSMFDGDLYYKEESNSIENQRLYLREYIDLHSDLVGDVIEYVDDGFTGSNFERPGFKRMLNDARSGKINVIVAKDLSRLGRNYIELGNYLDQIFPKIGVRVIAVNSDYDSKEQIGNIGGLDTAIRNFINTMYCRDISEKQKASYRSRWSRGLATHNQVPYGYIKDPDHRGQWLVDEEAASVIRKIFELAADGWKIKDIVTKLNQEHIEPPAVHIKRTQHYGRRQRVADHEQIWDYSRVRNIVKSEEYIGTHCVHKRESTIFDCKKTKNLPPEEWIRLNDHHIALVSKKTFSKAQSAIKKIKKSEKVEPWDFALKGKLRCGNCYLMMHYYDFNKKVYCAHRKQTGDRAKCYPESLDYASVEQLVFEALQRYLRDMQDLELVVRTNIGTHRERKQRSARSHEDMIETLKAERIHQYELYATGKISASAYSSKKAELTAEIEDHKAVLEKVSTEIRKDDEVLAEMSETSAIAGRAASKDELTRETVESFIKTVYVYDRERIEIIYTTEDLIDKAVRRNEEVTNSGLRETKYRSSKGGTTK